METFSATQAEGSHLKAAATKRADDNVRYLVRNAQGSCHSPGSARLRWWPSVDRQIKTRKAT